MQDMNSVNLVGRLTKDPELRSLPSGTSLASLRVAFTTSRKNNQTSQWEDVSNYVDVTVWGNQGENVARYTARGSKLAISGRLEYREYTDGQGAKRSAHQIVAHAVQFLDSKQDSPGGGQSAPASHSTPPASAPASAPPADDDIPF